MKKRSLSLILIPVLLVTLVLSAFACSQPTPSPSPTTAPTTTAAPKPTASPTGQVYKLKAASYQPNQGANPAMFKAYADMVTQQTNGRVQFDFFWAGTLAIDKELYRATQTGVADLSVFTVSNIPQFIPITEVSAYCGYLYSTSFGAATKAAAQLFKEYPQFAQEFETKGNQKLLFQNATPNYDLITKKPIKTVADFKGMRIRVYNPQLAAIFNFLGAAGTNVAAAETYDALNKNLLDGTPGSVELIARYNFQEVAKNYLRMYLGAKPISQLYTMNLDTWKKLPPDIQAVFIKVAEQDIVPVEIKLTDDEIKEKTPLLVKQNVVFTDMTPEVAKKVNESRTAPDMIKLEKAWIDKVTAQGMPAAQMLQRLKDLSDKFSAEEKK